MYLQYYSLVEEPFSVTADPRFLFMSSSHEEAMAHLLYSVQNKKGFVAITGGVGTGKTTLLNSLITQLEDSSYTFAFIYQSASTTRELMTYIFKDLEINEQYETRSEYLTRLNDFLLEELQQQRKVILVIDEAQNLSVEVLEDLRLISNLETSREKLIQIVLAGQSELSQMLQLPELRQLNQRIAIRYHLGSLSEPEVRDYIWHRLKIAGSPRDDIFSNAAIHEIFRYSHGVPRVINQLCDTALLKGYMMRKAVIDDQLIRSVVEDEFKFRDVDNSFEEEPDVGTPNAAPAVSRRGMPVWVWVLILLLVAVASYAIWQMQVLKQDSDGSVQTRVQQVTDPVARDQPETAPVENAAEQQNENVIVKDTLKSEPSADADVEEPTFEPQSELHDIRAETSEQTHVQVEASITPDSSVVQSPGATTVRVREGDWLVKILQDHYHFCTWQLIDEVLQHNPHIRNPNFIRVGDRIHLPQIDPERLEVFRQGVPVI